MVHNVTGCDSDDFWTVGLENSTSRTVLFGNVDNNLLRGGGRSDRETAPQRDESPDQIATASERLPRFILKEIKLIGGVKIRTDNSSNLQNRRSAYSLCLKINIILGLNM